MDLVSKFCSASEQSLLARLSLSGLGGLLFALSFIYPHTYFLAWVAFVPLLVAIEATGKSNYRQIYLCGMTFGLVFFGLAAHWVTDFITILKGHDALTAYLAASAFWLYSAQLPATLVLAYRWMRNHSGLPGILVFPVCATFVYSIFPMVFHLPIGAGQIEFLPAIQAISITGVMGLDFVIAMTNAAIAGILTGHLKLRTHKKASIAVAATLACWFGYGIFSTAHWAKQMDNSDTIPMGIVQPNQAPQLGETILLPGFSTSYPPELDMTERLVVAGAKLVIWPETTYKAFYDEQRVNRIFKHHVDTLDVFLIFPDTKKHSNHDENFMQNKTALIAPSGQQLGEHAKSKLMPFGEALPLSELAPWTSEYFRKYFRSILRELTPGKKPVTFEIAELKPDLKITPLICYESLFPEYTAMATPDEKASRVIAISSNNSWFGNTFQPQQHQNAAALRAVENRAVLVHAMNNGPSAVYLPNGQKVFSTRIGQAGGYLVNTPIAAADMPPLFSRFPQVISALFNLAFLIVLVASGWRRWFSPSTR